MTRSLRSKHKVLYSEKLLAGAVVGGAMWVIVATGCDPVYVREALGKLSNEHPRAVYASPRLIRERIVGSALDCSSDSLVGARVYELLRECVREKANVIIDGSEFSTEGCVALLAYGIKQGARIGVFLEVFSYEVCPGQHMMCQTIMEPEGEPTGWTLEGITGQTMRELLV